MQTGGLAAGIDLDEIEPALAGLGHGLGQAHHAERFAVGIDDDENFAGANLVVGADEGFVDGDNASQVRGSDSRRLDMQEITANGVAISSSS